MKTLLLAALFATAIPLTASAVTPVKTNPPRESLKAGAEVSILEYYKDSDAFSLELNHERAVGPNYCTPEDLKDAIGMEGSVADFKKRAMKDQDTAYVLKKKLLLLWPKELEMRKRKAKAAAHR